MEPIKIQGDTLIYALGFGTGAVYRIPDGIRKIGHRAFSNNASLREIVFPDGLEEIGEGAFAGCTSLKTVSIPPSVGRVGAEAFKGCTSLTKVSIPSMDSAVYGKDCWSRCGSLSEFKVGDTPARIIYFPVEDSMLVCLELEETELGIKVYVGRYAQETFPTGESKTGHVYVAFSEDLDGKEYWWYSTHKEDAVAGAFYQANHNTISERFGKLGWDTELDFREVSQICGFCIWGMAKWCETLKIPPDRKMKVGDIMALMCRCAPGAARRFAFVLEHQDEDLEVLAQKNHMTIEMIKSPTPVENERLTKLTDW